MCKFCNIEIPSVLVLINCTYTGTNKQVKYISKIWYELLSKWKYVWFLKKGDRKQSPLRTAVFEQKIKNFVTSDQNKPIYILKKQKIRPYVARWSCQ